jgi:multiple sugar transport system permease protein
MILSMQRNEKSRSIKVSIAEIAHALGLRGPGKTTGLKEDTLGYILILPMLAVLAVLIFLPLLSVIWDSLTNKTFLSRSWRFIGLDNYGALVASPAFWAIVAHSLIWTAFSVALQIIAGLVMALFLNQAFIGRAFFRGLFLLPWVIPVVVVSVIWKWILNDLYGVAGYLLEYVYPPWAHLAWFSDPTLALATLIAINVWRGAPFAMVILLAGLQTVPRDQLEAARIDGANAIQQFWHVTVPHLRRILLIVALVFALFNFNNFDLIYLTTQGGPLDLTMTLPVKTYEVAFKGLEVGQSSALAVIMLALLAMLSIIYLNYARITSDTRG